MEQIGAEAFQYSHRRATAQDAAPPTKVPHEHPISLVQRLRSTRLRPCWRFNPGSHPRPLRRPARRTAAAAGARLPADARDVASRGTGTGAALPPGAARLRGYGDSAKPVGEPDHARSTSRPRWTWSRPPTCVLRPPTATGSSSLFDPMALWRAQCAAGLTGHALPSGPYIPEEVPAATAEHLLRFFSP